MHAVHRKCKGRVDLVEVTKGRSVSGFYTLPRNTCTLDKRLESCCMPLGNEVIGLMKRNKK